MNYIATWSGTGVLPKICIGCLRIFKATFDFLKNSTLIFLSNKTSQKLIYGAYNIVSLFYILHDDTVYRKNNF
jgi:hypothetical protein